ncbi:NAD(+) diphosphatase [Algicola sagamiensis]|uniref:NAD(+) diphosphatase n=1 Tax=Algicola sagamiensis TaxID=163869 RepID=UPI00035C8ABC|nr:NAD(+) diphosphatase [Algicola sagamiensis]
MIQHSQSVAEGQEAWWFVCIDHRIWMWESTTGVPCCSIDMLPLDGLEDMPHHVIGHHEDLPCVLIQYQHAPNEADHFVNIRQLLGAVDDQLFFLAARACQVNKFLLTHQYCGQCGQAMALVEEELATLCEHCHHRCYPRISPCIIVGIQKGKDILLARGPHSPKDRFSVLAGFVESGETLEQAVEREVMEEVGVTVRNIRYFGSQPWPFPHSLMIGFTADYVSGEIVPQPGEIEEAAWFALNDLPNHPSNVSISGRIIHEIKKKSQCRSNRR